MEGSQLVVTHILRGVEEPARLHERVVAFRAAIAKVVAGDTQLFVGDEVEKGQSAPDRRTDLSGTPVFLAITPLAPEFDAGAALTALAPAQEHLVTGTTGNESWLLKHQFERRRDIGAPVPGDAWLQIVMMNVDAAVEDEFNDWYDQEHVERIAAVAPEFLFVKRMQALVGTPHYVALWRMTDRRGPERDPWLAASETPWTRRIRRFMRDRRRFMLAPFRATRSNATA